MTWLDRVISQVSPSAGLRRIQARAAMQVVSGYLGGRRDRTATMQWRVGVEASPDAETLPDLDLLRARSHDLIRNDPLAQSAISTKVAHVVGSGHIVRPEVDADRVGLSQDAATAWEELALDIWTDWAGSRDCDVTRSQSFAELEDLVYRSRLASGDVFVLRRFRARPGRALASSLQVIEAGRVTNPNWAADCDTLAGGIERDLEGAPVALHVANRYALDLAGRSGTRWTRVPWFDGSGRATVLHIHGPRLRPDMTRYAPMLAPVIEALKQRSRYSEAELMAAVISACFAIGMKSADADMSEGMVASPTQSSGSDKQIVLNEPGMIVDLMPNEEIQSFAPGRPNPQFTPFIDTIAREVGAGVDLPQELLVKQFQASYSASKAAMEMAWLYFRADRAAHVAQFCQPVYEDVISEAVARGMLKAKGFWKDPLLRRGWLGTQWMGPARPTIDPTKDAQADAAYLEMGATSLTRITAERFGVDIRTVRRRRAEDGSDDYAGQSSAGPAAPAQPNDPSADGSDKETPDNAG